MLAELSFQGVVIVRNSTFYKSTGSAREGGDIAALEVDIQGCTFNLSDSAGKVIWGLVQLKI